MVVHISLISKKKKKMEWKLPCSEGTWMIMALFRFFFISKMYITMFFVIEN